MEINAVSEANTPLKVQFLIIAYKDLNTKRWKVIGGLPGRNVDIDHQVEYFGRHLQDPFPGEQDNYLTYGSWLLEAGRIKEARSALMTSLAKVQLDKSKWAGKFRLQAEALLGVIKNVTGE